MPREVRRYEEDEGYGYPMHPWSFNPHNWPPPAPWDYHPPPQPMYDPRFRPRRSKRSRRRLRRKLDLGWKVMAYILVSFIVASFSPGACLIMWAVGPIILVRSCVRDVYLIVIASSLLLSGCSVDTPADKARHEQSKESETVRFRIVIPYIRFKGG